MHLTLHGCLWPLHHDVQSPGRTFFVVRTEGSGQLVQALQSFHLHLTLHNFCLWLAQNDLQSPGLLFFGVVTLGPDGSGHEVHALQKFHVHLALHGCGRVLHHDLHSPALLFGFVV